MSPSTTVTWPFARPRRGCRGGRARSCRGRRSRRRRPPRAGRHRFEPMAPAPPVTRTREPRREVLMPHQRRRGEQASGVNTSPSDGGGGVRGRLEQTGVSATVGRHHSDVAVHPVRNASVVEPLSLVVEAARLTRAGLPHRREIEDGQAPRHPATSNAFLVGDPSAVGRKGGALDVLVHGSKAAIADRTLPRGMSALPWRGSRRSGRRPGRR